MLKQAYKGVAVILTLSLVFGCKKEKGEPPPNDQLADNYDRQPMLSNLADNYIIPAYSAYQTATNDLKAKATDFNAALTGAALDSLRDQWEQALLVWQDVAFLELGPAANISLRSQTNVYPVDTTEILSNIQSGAYDLELPENFDAKGFQAIDYLINGIAGPDDSIVSLYAGSPATQNYLQAVTDELADNANSILSSWQGDYSTSFIDNSASNAIGSSVSDLVNALNLHYETYIRKGKVGLPAGVFNGFSETPLPTHVEALYFGRSLPFLHRSLDAIRQFLNGENYTSQENGEGLDDYMRHVKATTGGQPLEEVIDNQFDDIRTKLATVNDPLAEAVVSDNATVRSLYEELQEMVAMLKVTMTNALDVSITYQDTDGD